MNEFACLFSDSSCDIQIIDRRITFASEIGSVISLLPLVAVMELRRRASNFRCTNGRLNWGVREGTSNTVVSSMVTISVKEGSLLLFITKPKIGYFQFTIFQFSIYDRWFNCSRCFKPA